MLGLGLIGNLLGPKGPVVTFLDAASDVTDLTVYTFSAMNLRIPFNNFSIASESGGTGPQIRSKDKAVVLIAVHGEDALATFTVSSVTLGGVAGTAVVDEGGAGVVDTAWFLWECAALAGITTTDVVVTFSEAVTGCAVQAVLVSNLIQTSAVSSGSSVGTGSIGISSSSTLPLVGNSVVLFASTNDTGTAAPNFVPEGTTGTFDAWSGEAPIILNADSNAEFAYAVGYRRINQADLHTSGTTYSRSFYNWSAGVFSNVAVLLQ